MPRRAKTPLFNEFNRSKNAFGPRARDPETWPEYLDNTKPLTLELGCGKAEVSLELARRYGGENFIGIDLKADRLWRASKTALEENLTNAAFIQADILDIGQYFDEQSVKSIWLTFPDPYPKKSQAKRRMLNKKFLYLYKKILLPGGAVHMKTDNTKLFKWAVALIKEQKDIELLETNEDLHNSDLNEEYKIMTTFERRFVSEGKSIKFLSFRFRN